MPDLQNLNCLYSAERATFVSKSLKRTAVVDVFIPCNFYEAEFPKLLIVNDGQDLHKLNLMSMLAVMQEEKDLSVVVMAVHAGERLSEFGISGYTDDRGGGNVTTNYHDFLINDIFDRLMRRFSLSIPASETALVGFSLSALSAFDFAWHNSHLVGKVGCFSGSFWWRLTAERTTEHFESRVIIELVKSTTFVPPLRVWLQAGTEDEPVANDAQWNDSIIDTRALVNVLTVKGFANRLYYLEVVGGKHDYETWSKAMPNFLRWALL